MSICSSQSYHYPTFLLFARFPFTVPVFYFGTFSSTPGVLPFDNLPLKGATFSTPSKEANDFLFYSSCFVFVFTGIHLSKRMYQHFILLGDFAGVTWEYRNSRCHRNDQCHSNFHPHSSQLTLRFCHELLQRFDILIMDGFDNNSMVLLDMTDVRLKTAYLTDKLISTSLAPSAHLLKDRQAVQNEQNTTIERNPHITNHG